MLVLNLHPHTEESKCWVAEITGEDPVYKFKREFVQANPPGTWQLDDGWYQINGLVIGVADFSKEYVQIRGQQMRRHLTYHDITEDMEAIKENESHRVERMRKEITLILDEIKEAAYCEQVVEGIDLQKEDLDMCDEPDQIKQALFQLRKRKQEYIDKYRKMFQL